MSVFQTFKRFFKRKTPSALGSRFPLSLRAEQWAQLQALVQDPAWASYRALLEHYGTIHAFALLQPLSPDQTNVERGKVAALFEIAALPELLISHWKEIERDRTKRERDERDRDELNRGYDFSWQFGNPLFSDDFRARE